MRDVPETPLRVEAGRHLAGERLVVNETICACRYDGSLVEVHGLEHTPLDTGNLGAHKRRTVLEILRANFCPGSEQSFMNPKCFQMLSVRVRLFGLAQSG